MRLTLIFVLVAGLSAPALAQVFEIPYRSADNVVDGFLHEWEGVPKLVLVPGGAHLKTNGEFKENDVSLTLQATWDEEAIYVAVEWVDDIWDIRKIRRSEAVFVTPDKQRRNRMLFYDNLMLQVRELKYEYLLWTSPRVDDQGPFYWQRRRTGAGNLEGATTPPVITPRQEGNRVTMEFRFQWDELRLKLKKSKKDGLPFFIAVADGDLPGSVEENKLSSLKWLEWSGRFELKPKR